jgi:hypothetical protein
MSCSWGRDDDRASRYVLGDLPEDEREAFEQHFLECPDCLALMQALAELPAVLGEQPLPSTGRARLPSWALAAAATVFAAVGVSLVLRHAPEPLVQPPTPTTLGRASPVPAPSSESPPALPSPVRRAAPAIEDLARVEPPRYLPLTMRGQAPDPAFDEAMAFYARARYAEAAKLLAPLAERDPQSRFFRGVALLMSDDAEAVDELERTAALEVPPWSVAARFFLAKAHLRQKDLAGARRELALVVATQGTYSTEARRLLRALDEGSLR